jgi:hypothetical protein
MKNELTTHSMTNTQYPEESMKNNLPARVVASSIKALAILFGVGLILYFVVVAWLHSNLSGQAISISQAAGAPVEAEKFLGGFLSWILAFSLVPAFAGLILRSLNPLKRGNEVTIRILMIMAIGLAMALLPTALRTIRGVDASGLPTRMSASDPAAAIWWTPNNEPVLFYSYESEGNLRFWNRPGTTPDTGSQSRPVTKEIRAAWEKMRSQETSMRIEEEKEMQLAIAEAKEEARILSERMKSDFNREKDLALAEARRIEQARAAQIEALREESRKLREAKDATERALSDSRAKTNRAIVPVSLRGSAGEETLMAQPSREPSQWMTRTISPGMFSQANGKSNSKIEFRSNSSGVIERPGMPPIYFSGGIFSFESISNSFRIHSRDPRPFKVTFRWLPR